MEMLLLTLALYVAPALIAFAFGALIWAAMPAKREAASASSTIRPAVTDGHP